MAQQAQQQQNLPDAQVKKIQKETIDNIGAQVAQMLENGKIRFPKDYAWENEIKLAWLLLLKTQDKNKRPAIDVCSKKSIINTFLEMLMKGLQVSKKQCYFIPYGGDLTLSESYFGRLATLKRVVDVVSIGAQVVYEGDDFAYTIDPDDAKFRVVHHEQKTDNIDFSKLKSAYAVIRYKDGESNEVKREVSIMTMQQIRTAWAQGYGYSDTSKVHNNFTDEMAKKTVISRCAKMIINSSSDAHLFDDEEVRERGKFEAVTSKAKEIPAQVVSFDDVDEETGEIHEAPKQVEAPKGEPLRAQTRQAVKHPIDPNDPSAPF